ncbi:MLO-like protein 15 [Humulus lupulus]|uniref:MLO-like protein 15 n=1 Tax=Humulus lupulus TaxID=3486 RepID=UPI002B417C39|nr:MLO-like protein 15 [Humulus lupulus]
MLLGFITLLLTVFQNRIAKICISEDQAKQWLPCSNDKDDSSSKTTHHFQTLFATIPRLLAKASSSDEYCSEKLFGWMQNKLNGKQTTKNTNTVPATMRHDSCM